MIVDQLLEKALETAKEINDSALTEDAKDRQAHIISAALIANSLESVATEIRGAVDAISKRS